MNAAGEVKAGLVLGGFALVALAIWWLYKHADLFNPASQNNLANQGFNTAYQDITGSSGSLGTDLYNLTHPNTPGLQTPANAICFQRNPDGSLVYVNGVIQEVPCSQNPPGWQTP